MKLTVNSFNRKRAVVDSRRKCETPVKSNMDESSDITAKCRLDETPTWSDLETDMALSSPLLPSASPRKYVFSVVSSSALIVCFKMGTVYRRDFGLSVSFKSNYSGALRTLCNRVVLFSCVM